MKFKRCVICQRKINEEKDDYFKVELYSNGKLLGNDYAHRKCYQESQNPLRGIQQLVKGVTNYAKSAGVYQEEVVIE